MRWWFSILLVLAIPAVVFARPKVAVAPLDGDSDGKVSEAIAEAASDHAKVIGPDRVERAMKGADADRLDAKTLKRLRAKLEVDVVIYGSVDRNGGTKHLELTFAGGGKNNPRLELDFKSTKTLRRELGNKLGKRIDQASEGGEEEDDESSPFKKKGDDDDGEERTKKRDEDERARKRDEAERAKRDEEDRRRKKDDEEREKKRKKDDEEREKKRRRDDDEERTSKRKRDRDDDDDGRSRKRVADDDEDSGTRKRLDDEDEDDDDFPRKRKRKRRGEERPRNPVTQAALWLDGGAAVARRTFTYKGTGTMQPPPVGTAAPSARVEAELYPAAFSTLKGAAAGFGIAGHFNQTFGLGIEVPGTGAMKITAPIKNAHYAIGARYRFAFAQSSIALGVSYWRRHFIADRSGLMMPTQLDMPDVDYTAVAGELSARVGLTPKAGAFLAVQVPLMLDSGPIQANTSYGPSTIIAFDVRAGAQIALGTHYAVQVNAEVDQIGFKFAGKMGTQAALRGVTAATDRSIGIAATLAVMY